MKHFASYLYLLLVIYTFIPSISKLIINIIISAKGIHKINNSLYKGHERLTYLILQEKQQVPDKWRDACKLLKFD